MSVVVWRCSVCVACDGCRVRVVAWLLLCSGCFVIVGVYVGAACPLLCVVYVVVVWLLRCCCCCCR